MTGGVPKDAGSGPERSLPRRDFVLIPLICLLTLLTLLVSAELVAGRMFVESGAETCATNSETGVPMMRPNCVSHRKAAEGPPLVNRYNDCGYRTAEPCEPRRARAIRVAVMGASTAQGFKIPYEETFAARLTESLGAACGRPVEFQNMGIAGISLLDIYRRTEEALAMRPDLIMLVLTAYDLKSRADPQAMAARDDPPRPRAQAAPEAPASPALEKSFVARLSDLAANSRAMIAAQHYLFMDRPTYVRLFMLHGDDAGYLRARFSPAWEERLHDADLIVEGMARRAAAQNVPVMLVVGPMRIQAALLGDVPPQEGADPYAFGKRMAEIARRHGIGFLDTLDGFARIAAPESLFYAWDGHMDGAGSAVFADAVFDRLTHGAAGAFANCQVSARPGQARP